jgi:hypothetical protein
LTELRDNRDNHLTAAALVRGIQHNGTDPAMLPTPLLDLAGNVLLGERQHTPVTIDVIFASGADGAAWVARTTTDTQWWHRAAASQDPHIWHALAANPAVPRTFLVDTGHDGGPVEHLVAGSPVGTRRDLAVALGVTLHGTAFDAVVAEAIAAGPAALDALCGDDDAASNRVRGAVARQLADCVPDAPLLAWVAQERLFDLAARARLSVHLEPLRTRRTPHLDAWLDALAELDLYTRRVIVCAGVPANVLQRIDRDRTDGVDLLAGTARRRYLPGAYLRERHKMFPQPRRLSRRRARWFRRLGDADVCVALLEQFALDRAPIRRVTELEAHIRPLAVSDRVMSSLARHACLHQQLFDRLDHSSEPSRWEVVRMWQHLAWHQPAQRAQFAARHPKLARHAYLADMDPTLFRDALDRRLEWTREWLDDAYTTTAFDDPAHGRIGGDSRWILDHVADAGVRSLQRWHPAAVGAAVAIWQQQLGRDESRWETLLALLGGWQLSVREAGTAARRLGG